MPKEKDKIKCVSGDKILLTPKKPYILEKIDLICKILSMSGFPR